MNLIELKAAQYDDMAAIQFLQKRMNDRENEIKQVITAQVDPATDEVTTE